jgi:hypothetical protein
MASKNDLLIRERHDELPFIVPIVRHVDAEVPGGWCAGLVPADQAIASSFGASYQCA